MHQKWNFCTPVYLTFLVVLDAHTLRDKWTCLAIYVTTLRFVRSVAVEPGHHSELALHIPIWSSFGSSQIFSSSGVSCFCTTGSSIIAFTHANHWTLWQNILLHFTSNKPFFKNRFQYWAPHSIQSLTYAVYMKNFNQNFCTFHIFPCVQFFHTFTFRTPRTDCDAYRKNMHYESARYSAHLVSYAYSSKSTNVYQYLEAEFSTLCAKAVSSPELFSWLHSP
jgi:hypothetical protein